LKRSYAFPRKLIYKSIPLAMAGLLSCGGGTKTSSNDGSPSMNADLAGTCPIDDMGDQVLPGTCFATNGSGQTCPTFACSQADCPNGCDFEVLA
jgi:hypothetical protein